MDTEMETHHGGASKVYLYDDLFNNALLSRRIGISMYDLIKTSTDGFKGVLESKLRLTYEGLCVKEGYVKYDSITLITYSSGIMKGNLMEFDVVFQCLVCIPVSGMKLKCMAQNITKAGIRATIADLPVSQGGRAVKSPLVVFVARDHYYDNDTFNALNEKDKFVVEIIGTRYELNDEYICVIADLVV